MILAMRSGVIGRSRTRTPMHALRRFVVPTLAALGFLVIFSLANRNFVDLTGTSSQAAYTVLALIYGLGVGGVCWAIWLRTHRPRLYEEIGRN